MGQKINKASLLEEIDKKIKACEMYQAKQPDESASKRVAVLDKNPCADGTYFTVVTLKAPVSEKSTNPDDLLSKREDKFIDVDINQYSKLFSCGCIIKYDLKKDNVSVTKYSSNGLSQLLEKMVEYGMDEKGKILRFLPSKTGIFSSFIKYACLKEDYDTYKDSYDTLYYSFGRFNDISKYLEGSGFFDPKTKKLYNYSFPFEQVTYVDKTKKTSFEKNVNNELDPGILNEITNYGQKSEQVNFSLASQPIVDFGNYILNRLSELSRSDDRILGDYYANHSQKFSWIAKYDAYKAFGGGSDWPGWYETVAGYNSFKIIASNKKSYENAMKNATYKTNLVAQEQAAFLFNNNYAGIKYLYKEGDYKPISSVSSGSSTIQSYVQTHFVDPLRFVVKSVAPTGNVDLIFNKTRTYTFEVPVKSDDKTLSKNEKTGDTFIFLTSKDVEMEKAICKYVGTNTEEVNRDQVLIDGNTYKLVESQITLTDGSKALDEIAKKTSDTIQGNVYYNEGLKAYFKAEDLIKRLTTFRINYTLTPHEVEVIVKSYCAESSQYKETCTAALKKEQQKRGKLILRACVDTISYDPWEKLKDKLKKVYYAYAKIQANKDGYILVPPVESDQVKAAKTKCKKCGKTKNLCECEDPKLCDKIFPLDLFGVTGLLGLDNLLSKLGLFTTNAYIIDQNDNKVTYAEAAEYFYTQIYEPFGYEMTYEPWLFEMSGETSQLILDMTFDDVKNCPDYQVKYSIANQMTEKDFNNFKKVYSELLDVGDVEGLTTKNISRELNVGIADGYAYIPTGKSVTYVYNLMRQSFSIKGWGSDPITSVAQAALFSLVSSINEMDCEEYVTAAENLKNSMKVAFDLSEDAQINLVYPYMPKIEAILGAGGDNESEVEGYNFAFMYIPNPSSIKNFISELGKPKDVDITFDIYLKEPIKCGFPKNKNPKCRSNSGSNGKCGLEELFKGAIDAGPVKFDFDIELRKLKSKVLKYKMKKDTDDSIKNFKTMSNFACNIEKNIEDVNVSKNDALDVLYTAGKELAPIMNLFPLKCLTDAMNDGKNAICSASRKVQDKSAIDDFSDSVTHKLKTIGVVANDAWASSKQKFNNIVGGFKNSLGPIQDSMGKLWDNASVYNLCPSRFSDYISDSGIAKSFGEGLTGIMKNSTLDVLKNVLGSCMVDGIIDSALGGVTSILDSEKGNVKRILEEGDPAAIERLGQQYPELLEKFGSSSGGLDFNKIVSNPTFNTSFMQSFETEIAKRMNPGSLMSGVVDKFTDPNNIVNFLQSGVKMAIQGGGGQMTASLLEKAGGVGLDSISSSMQGNITKAVANTLSQDNSKEAVNADIISTMNSYIMEKAELYSVIKNGEEIPNLNQ